jgi:chorismate dehydratase
MTLRVGQIEYANCTPIFATLKSTFDCRNYHFIGGVPAQLNRMLGQGGIDVCPSSSFEYGRNPDKYCLLPDISISSVGAVKSVLLFSRVPLEELNNKTIGLTTESATSVNLLRILLAKKYGFVNAFESTSLPLQEALGSFSALLLIGDQALKEGMRKTDLFVYDMGELWYGFTGLPFVFALWMVNRESAEKKADEVTVLCTELIAAKRLAYETYGTIADCCGERGWIDREALIDYWRTISYDLTPRHIEGLTLFFRYALEMELIRAQPDIRIFDGRGP